MFYKIEKLNKVNLLIKKLLYIFQDLHRYIIYSLGFENITVDVQSFIDAQDIEPYKCSTTNINHSMLWCDERKIDELQM